MIFIGWRCTTFHICFGITLLFVGRCCTSCWVWTESSFRGWASCYGCRRDSWSVWSGVSGGSVLFFTYSCLWRWGRAGFWLGSRWIGRSVSVRWEGDDFSSISRVSMTIWSACWPTIIEGLDWSVTLVGVWPRSCGISTCLRCGLSLFSFCTAALQCLRENWVWGEGGFVCVWRCPCFFWYPCMILWGGIWLTVCWRVCWASLRA